MQRERRAAFTVGSVGLLAFLFLAVQVAMNGYLAAAADPAVTRWLAVHRTEAATAVLMLVTRVHSTLGIDLMLAAAALYVGLVRHRWRDAFWLILAVQSAMLLNVVLKTAFARLRPDIDVPLVHLSTFSFPSGHALASTVLWGCIWLLLPSGRGRSVAGALVILVIALVCASRVYLGAHFLTDVLGGVSEGAFCVAAWSLALPAFRRRRANRPATAAERASR